MRAGIFVLFSIFAFAMSGQQITEPSLVGFNLFDTNVAFAGQYGRSNLTVRHRAQWQGFEGAPSWNYLSFHTPTSSNLGIGAKVMQENIGAFSTFQVAATISWKTRVKDGFLAFGLEGGWSRSQLDVASLQGMDGVLVETGESVTMSQPLFNSGVMYRTKHFFIGAMAKNLVHRSWSINEQTIGKSELHGTAHLGTHVRISEGFILRPLVNMRYANQSQLSAEAQLGLWFRRKLLIGSGYRSSGEITALAEVQVKKKFRIGYAFEYSTGALKQVQNGSHELFLSFLFGELFSAGRMNFNPVTP
ncbi:MAG: PorP/SprF family type IX secretion system membrane protein [Flavobacteriales bacterium]